MLVSRHANLKLPQDLQYNYAADEATPSSSSHYCDDIQKDDNKPYPSLYNVENEERRWLQCISCKRKNSKDIE